MKKAETKCIKHTRDGAVQNKSENTKPWHMDKNGTDRTDALKAKCRNSSACKASGELNNGTDTLKFNLPTQKDNSDDKMDPSSEYGADDDSFGAKTSHGVAYTEWPSRADNKGTPMTYKVVFERSERTCYGHETI